MDAKTYSLIILTRFNLAIKYSTKKRYDSNTPDEEPWLDEKYLQERFAIFENYTLQALMNQTDMDFRWIVLFHENTPLKFKYKIEEICNRMKQFEALFLDDKKCEKQGDYISAYLKQEYPSGDIITVRIDNDDVVHESFVETIKKDIDGCNAPCVLTYSNGLQYDVQNKRLLKYRCENNHFLALLASSTAVNNHILLYNHGMIDKISKNIGIYREVRTSSAPLWVEIITESNYVNSARYRFSALNVSYEIKKEYPLLELKWNDKKAYTKYIWGG